MNLPKISIIIPTYNCSGTLENTINSIINQSYENKELVIVDGLSNDPTLKIIKWYVDKYAFVRWISEKDNGIYDAMNKGIDIATGEWIYFLGSDDSLYNENVMSNIFNNKNNLHYDVLYGNVYSPKFNSIYDGKFSIEKIINQNICHQAIFYKKTLFDIKGRFDLKYRAFADWDYNLRWFLDNRIRKKYIKLIVANFSVEGFSSKGDPLFSKDKHIKLLEYARYRSIFNQKYADVLFNKAFELKNSGNYQEARRLLLRTFLSYPLCIFWWKVINLLFRLLLGDNRINLLRDNTIIKYTVKSFKNK